MKTKLIEK